MQSTIMTQELTHADISKIQSLQQKRTLAFVNHFITTNVQFLNNFMRNCEQKLMTFERKLEKVNAAMVLLEARLSSIPELSNTASEPAATVTATPITPEQASAPPTEDTNQTNAEPEQTENIPNSQARPEYDRFIKMVQVGVPVQAVKLKVSLEGLDPEVLEEILRK